MKVYSCVCVCACVMEALLDTENKKFTCTDTIFILMMYFINTNIPQDFSLHQSSLSEADIITVKWDAVSK